MADMLQALEQNGLHMSICQGVENGFSIPAGLDQCCMFQNPQLMGDGALVHVQAVRDLLDAQFLPAQH